MILTILYLLSFIVNGSTLPQEPLLIKEKILFKSGCWNQENWNSVDDRVRGGNSHSYVSIDPDLKFYGILDTTTLGGAGFASIKYSFEEYQDWSVYDQLIIEYRSLNDMKPTLNLYSEFPKDRGDGRNTSQIAYKTVLAATNDWRVDSFSLLNDFMPTYRGRDSPDLEPLNLKRIASISLMMQSFFDEQSGPFEVHVNSITLRKLGQ